MIFTFLKNSISGILRFKADEVIPFHEDMVWEDSNVKLEFYWAPMLDKVYEEVRNTAHCTHV